MDVLRGQWGRLAGPLGMACPYGGVPGVVLEIASTIDPCTCRVQGIRNPGDFTTLLHAYQTWTLRLKSKQNSEQLDRSPSDSGGDLSFVPSCPRSYNEHSSSTA